MKEYKFYGWQTADCKPADSAFDKIENPRHLYGILRDGGNYHCYNVVPLPDGGECLFDLTSEQFGDEKLNYENNPEQFREVHFAKEEKHLRYNYLKAELLKKVEEM